MPISISHTQPSLRLAVVDCRAEQDFYTGHVTGAISIPAAELFARMHELPMRSEPLILYIDEISRLPARDFLLSKGYTILQEHQWTNTLHQQLEANGQLETGATRHSLWQAAPLIRRWVEEFMPSVYPSAGKGLDVGCGAGRDMVYLAQHGWNMTGIDHLAGALKRTQDLATHHQVTVNTVLCNLEGDNQPLTDWPDHSFDLIYGVRYLHRPLFPIFKRLLKPGGIFLYQTFMEGCELIGSPRNPHFLLKQGELAQLFKEATILLDEVDYLEDGRPLSAFIALMPALQHPHTFSPE